MTPWIWKNSIRVAPTRVSPSSMVAGAAAICALLLCTCSFSWTTARVTSAQLATEYKQGQAVNPTSVFSPSDHVLHLVVVVSNAPDDTKVGAVWYAVDAGGSKNQKLDSANVTLNGEDHLDLTLSNTANWPRGQYKVELMVDGKRDRSLSFEVQ
jgi:hypothetical protein